MEVKNMPGTCDRCCRLISPVLVLDGGDIAADCMDDEDAQIRICSECLSEMVKFMGVEVE